MKHFRILLPLLVLALMLSACGGEQSQEPYTYTFYGNAGEKTITVYPETQQIADGLDVYTYTIEESRSSTNYVLTYPNGSVFSWTGTDTGGAGGWSKGYRDERYLSEHTLLCALEQNQPREKLGNFGVGLLLMGLGAVNFFLPELPFHLRYGWAVENAEPSDAYIFWTKTGGVIAAIVGLITCFI